MVELMINHATVAAFETRECVINLLSFLFLTLTNEKQAIVAIFNKLSRLPIASFKNAVTEMILERFTLTMFYIANGKREVVPRDQVLLLLDFYKIRVVLDSFYLLIFYFESTIAVNVTLKSRYTVH